MENKKNVVIAILAVLVVALGVLLFITYTDKGKLADTNTSLDAQVKNLSGEKESLESQVASLKDESVQAAETAKAELEKAVQETKDTAQAQIDEAVKAKEDAETALKTAQDEATKAKEETEAAQQAVQETKDAAQAQIDEAVKLKEEAETALKTAQDEAAKAKEEAAAAQQTVQETKDAAQAQIDEAVKAKEEAESAKAEAEAALQAAGDKAVGEGSAETAPAAAASGEIDFAATFPSWNPDSASLKELVDFVLASVDESGSGYIPPADRIATFDMDGTIICEKAPIYIDSCLTMYRVLDDPTYSATEEERAAMQEMRDHAYATGENYKPETLTKDDLIGSAFAGMTPAEFRNYVANFADTVEAVGFKGMTYGQSFYKPMLEVIEFLRANDFDVWMVSACEREVVRGLVERLGFTYDHVVATDVVYSASGSEGKPADEYNMGQEEQILLSGPLNEIECGKSGKPVAIAREIGKQPVLAFGNSSGDFSMLNYAEGNPNYPGMGVLVVCDDTVREYGSEEKAADFYAEIEKQGWTAFSMANDWAVIYGEGVEKVGLPGAEEEEALPDAA